MLTSKYNTCIKHATTSTSTPKQNQLLQTQKQLQHSRVVRCSQSRHRIPTRLTREAIRITTLIGALRHIIQHIRVRIQRGVDEANRALTRSSQLIVNQRDDAAKHGATRARAIDVLPLAVNSKHVVGAIGTHIRERTASSRVVVPEGSVRGWVVCQKGVDGIGLVGRNVKVVGEAAARVNDGLAGGLGLGARSEACGDVCARGDLGGTYGGDVGACAWESWVEADAIVETLAVASDTWNALVRRVLLGCLLSWVGWKTVRATYHHHRKSTRQSRQQDPASCIRSIDAGHMRR